MPGGECLVDRRQLDADYLAALPDLDSLEERLIEDAPLERRARHVGRVRRLGARESLFERGLDLLRFEFGFDQTLSGLLLLGLQAALLARQYLVRDEALVGQLDEVSLIGLERFDLAPLLLRLGPGDGQARLTIAADVGANLVLL